MLSSELGPRADDEAMVELLFRGELRGSVPPWPKLKGNSLPSVARRNDW